MNIFILDEDKQKCVEYYCDEHIVKMQLEYAQLLCTTYWIDRILGYIPRKLTPQETEIIGVGYWQINKEENTAFYKPTHVNHPCAIWTRTSKNNFDYLKDLLNVANKEWLWRYEHPAYKTHKAHSLITMLPELNCLELKELTPFSQSMPEQYKQKDIVKAYRAYYKGEKQHLHYRKKRNKPDWMK